MVVDQQGKLPHSKNCYTRGGQSNELRDGKWLTSTRDVPLLASIFVRQLSIDDVTHRNVASITQFRRYYHGKSHVTLIDTDSVLLGYAM